MSEQIEGFSHGDKPSAHTWRIEIGGTDLQFAQKTLKDPVPTGRQIIEAAGHRDVAEFIVLQWLPDGSLSELRLEDTVDIVAEGIERFIVVRSDRSFRIEIEGRREEWPCHVITGQTVKKLAGQGSDDVIAVLERTDKPDRELEDDELVDLRAEGVERFRLKHVRPQVEILVNEKAVLIRRGLRSGLEIKQAAIEQGVAIQLDFILSLEKASGQTKIIGDDDRVRVKPGRHFNAIADDDNS